jgi:hypothetical protein
MTSLSVLSNYLGNKVLYNNLTNGICWLALHTDDPTVTGDLSTEVAGAGYIRQRITFSSASSKTVGSTNKQTFANMPAATILYMAVWDSQVTGNMLASIILGTPLVVVASGQVLCAAGDIAITV